MAQIRVTESAKSLSSLSLGSEFVRNNKLETGKTYSLLVEGVQSSELRGTLQTTTLIGGLAAMYRAYPGLKPDDEVEVEALGNSLKFTPPGVIASPTPPDSDATKSEYALERMRARSIFVEPYEPGAINRWEPKSETDVYMVYGRVAQFTPYRFCCATSMEILNKFGIKIEPKPDALLIESGTDRYLIAEFEVRASTFLVHGHKKDDIDVLVCWRNDIPDRSSELPKVLCLEELIKELIEKGDIDL
jgi:hypothetical protein